MKAPENRLASQSGIAAVMRGVRMFYFDPEVVRALADISFEVRRGEVFGLIGPDGSGKSTTMKILAGRLRPMEGKVTVFGCSPRRGAVRSRIGYLPQGSDRKGQADSVGPLALLGKLFGGSQRRITLAEVLVKNPDLVMLDEPFAGLDPAGGRELKELIPTLLRRGKTVILSSDSVSDAKDVCDRMAIYSEGKIQATGTLDELLARPDAVRFMAPVLSRAISERVLKVIRGEVGGVRMSAATAAENLENAFPDATRGILPAGTAPTGAAAEETLASLTRTAVAPPALEPLHTFTDPVNHERLAELTKPAPGLLQPNQEKAPASSNDAARANEKLSGMISPAKLL